MLDSFAQNAEDVVLWRALGHLDSGTYVDVGAADPEFDSVTKLFYDRGWSGVNVEPVAQYADSLRAQRPRDTTFQECAGESSGTTALYVVQGTGLSTVAADSVAELEDDGYAVHETVVDVRRLDDMLDQAGLGDLPIHFLKVDVEGYEREVLEGIDLERWRPWVVVVESTAPRTNASTTDKWEHLLLNGGYHFCLFDGLNRFYAATEHSELRDVLSYPACVFDQPYVTRPHREALQEYSKALDAYQALHSEYDGTLKSYRRLEGEYLRVVDALDSAQSAVTDLSEKCKVLREGVAAMSAEYERWRDDYENRLLDREQQLAGSQAEVVAIRQSTSWRITAPVRFALDRVRSVATLGRRPESGGSPGATK